ncbi:MAG: hypothetical protein HY909_05615 [Deltaproteobacteria bacterium]|nr:hypothetical protein [Deltaproteobacteria bacterium]
MHTLTALSAAWRWLRPPDASAPWTLALAVTAIACAERALPASAADASRTVPADAACVPRAGACSTTDDCCGLRPCVARVCARCEPRGAPCAAHDDCCPGLFCMASRCLPPGCLAAGSEGCAEDGDCCASRCTFPRCARGAPPPVAPMPAGPGAACDVAEACASSRCVGGVCREARCALDGEACEADTGCCTGLCRLTGTQRACRGS